MCRTAAQRFSEWRTQTETPSFYFEKAEEHEGKNDKGKAIGDYVISIVGPRIV